MSYLLDTFTEASGTPRLTAHTADVGTGAWTKHPSSDSDTAPNGGYIDSTNDEACGLPPTNQNNIYYHSQIAPSADVITTWEIVRRSAYNTGQGVRLYHRMSSSNLGAAGGYAVMALLANNDAGGINVYLYRYSNGSLAAIGTGATPVLKTFTQNAVTYLRLTSNGSTHTLDYSTDGTNWTQLHTGTDSGIPSAGYVGMAFTDVTGGVGNGIQISKVTGNTAGASAVLRPAGARAIRGLYTR